MVIRSLSTLNLHRTEVVRLLSTARQQARAAFLRCRPRRGKMDSRAAPPKPGSGTLRHDGRLDLASVFRQKHPPTPGRGMAANRKKHRIFSGLSSINARPLYKLKINFERKLPHYTN